MKCPKCGYNSFEYYGKCRKCSADFTDYKKTYSICPIVLPPEVRGEQADQFRASSSTDFAPAENVETHNDMFAFDIPEDPPPSVSPVAVQDDDPFNFDYELPDADSPKGKAEEGVFADLTGTPPRADDPFAAPAAPTDSSNSGEFDLDSFSWDETPAATVTDKGATAENTVTDDFDFFGDLTDAGKK